MKININFWIRWGSKQKTHNSHSMMISVTLLILTITAVAHGQETIINKNWVSERPLKVNESLTLQSFSLNLEKSNDFELDEWIEEAIVTQSINTDGSHRATSALFLINEDEVHFHITMSYWNFKKGDEFKLKFTIEKDVLHLKSNLDSAYFYIKDY